MPIYEYRCTLCGHELEALQKFSDAPLTGCPACNGEGLIKRVSAAGFQLKGSGWYATDFRGSGRKSTDGASDAKSDGKSDAKSDAKSGGESAGKAGGEGGSDTKSSSGTESAAPAGGCGSGCACH